MGNLLTFIDDMFLCCIDSTELFDVGMFAAPNIIF